MTSVANINDVLEGHVALEIECVDRLYLNAYVPRMQVGGQLVRFLRDHLGFEIPSPALLGTIGNRFRRDVKAFAADREIPILALKKPDRSRWDDRKLDHVRPYLDAAEREGRYGVVACQEFQWVFSARNRAGPGKVVSFEYFREERRVGIYYFYILDPEFGPGFIKIETYAPYSAKVWLKRARVGQTPSRPFRDHVHRAVQRLRQLRSTRAVAGRLRHLRPGARSGVLRFLDPADPDAADR